MSQSEGYVLHIYGDEKYVHHAVASVVTLRRHDSSRPVALYATEAQIELLHETGLNRLFELLLSIPEAHRSIVGFKHHLHRFRPFEKCLYVDADMVWCRNPDALWSHLSGFTFTATGLERADFFFGAPKGVSIVGHVLADRRRRTMRRFGTTYLPRVQAGLIYSSDTEITRAVCTEASSLLARRSETHFGSRLKEGRNEESCEWSIALAMSRLDLPVFNWFQGQNTPQMDYVPGYVRHDTDFENISCLYYVDRFVHGLRGIRTPLTRKLLTRFFSSIPGKGDYMWVTPFILHFGWLHYKQPYYDLAERLWTREQEEKVLSEV
jgi:hypothetical protein